MGEWKRSEISYLRVYRTTCELCGQLVPAKYWAAEVDGDEHSFCDPEHERLYRTYWLPRYGQGVSSMERKPVTSADAPPPSGTYSQAIRAGSLLFLS